MSDVMLAAARKLGEVAARLGHPVTGCPYNPESAEPVERAAARAYVGEFLRWRQPAAADQVDDVDQADDGDGAGEMARHLPGQHSQAKHGNRFKIPGDRASGLRTEGKERRKGGGQEHAAAEGKPAAATPAPAKKAAPARKEAAAEGKPAAASTAAPTSGPVPVADVKPGSYAQVAGVDMLGAKMAAAGWVAGVEKVRWAPNRQTKARDMLEVRIAEHAPDSKRRAVIFVDPQATATVRELSPPVMHNGEERPAGWLDGAELLVKKTRGGYAVSAGQPYYLQEFKTKREADAWVEQAVATRRGWVEHDRRTAESAAKGAAAERIEVAPRAPGTPRQYDNGGKASAIGSDLYEEMTAIPDAQPGIAGGPSTADTVWQVWHHVRSGTMSNADGADVFDRLAKRHGGRDDPAGGLLAAAADQLRAEKSRKPKTAPAPAKAAAAVAPSTTPAALSTTPARVAQLAGGGTVDVPPPGVLRKVALTKEARADYPHAESVNDLAPGDVVFVSAHGDYRRGVVTGKRRSNVTVAYTTETSPGHVKTATTSATNVLKHNPGLGARQAEEARQAGEQAKENARRRRDAEDARRRQDAEESAQRRAAVEASMNQQTAAWADKEANRRGGKPVTPQERADLAKVGITLPDPPAPARGEKLRTAAAAVASAVTGDSPAAVGLRAAAAAAVSSVAEDRRAGDRPNAAAALGKAAAAGLRAVAGDGRETDQRALPAPAKVDPAHRRALAAAPQAAGPLASMSDEDQRRVRNAVADRGPGIYASPMVGGSRSDVARYLAEGELGKQLADRHDWRTVREAVAQVVDENPALVERTPRQAKADAEARTARVDAIVEEAQSLLKTDKARTAALLDEALAIDPDHRLPGVGGSRSLGYRLSEIRDRVREQLPKALAPPAPPPAPAPSTPAGMVDQLSKALANAARRREQAKPAAAELTIDGEATAFVPGARSTIGLADRPQVGRQTAPPTQQLGLFANVAEEETQGQGALLDALFNPAADVLGEFLDAGKGGKRP